MFYTTVLECCPWNGMRRRKHARHSNQQSKQPTVPPKNATLKVKSTNDARLLVKPSFSTYIEGHNSWDWPFVDQSLFSMKPFCLSSSALQINQANLVLWQKYICLLFFYYIYFKPMSNEVCQFAGSCNSTMACSTQRFSPWVHTWSAVLRVQMPQKKELDKWLGSWWGPPPKSKVQCPLLFNLSN